MPDRDPRRMIIRLAVAMMATDGRITPNELGVLERLERSGLGPLRGLVEAELEQAARGPIDVPEACVVLAAARPEAVAAAFAVLADVAAADGALDERERRLLDAIAPRLGLAEDAAAEIVRAAEARMEPAAAPEPATAAARDPRAAAARVHSHEPPPASGAAAPPDGTVLARACAQLGVAPGADAAALDAAYRRMIARYDPTRVLDLGTEFAVLAVRRLADATAAYELLRARTA